MKSSNHNNLKGTDKRQIHNTTWLVAKPQDGGIMLGKAKW